MTSEKHLPPARVLNKTLTDALGVEVVKIEVLPVQRDETVRLTFGEVNSDWRQGVWVATQGLLVANEIEAAQFVLWADTAPRAVDIVVRETDGLLRFYNVWDSGRGIGGFESQSATSGMLPSMEGGPALYRCNDIGHDPLFNKLVFSIQRG